MWYVSTRMGPPSKELRCKYGIGGGSTIQQWIRTYGQDGLRHRVMRIQTVEEVDQVRNLQQEIARLQEALAQTLLEKIALEKTLALYQETFGTELAKKRSWVIDAVYHDTRQRGWDITMAQVTALFGIQPQAHY